MKHFAILSALALGLAGFGAAACGDDDDNPGLPPGFGGSAGKGGSAGTGGSPGTGGSAGTGGSPGTGGSAGSAPVPTMKADVAADITASTTWTADTAYTLKGAVFVKAPAELTIEAGTQILGDEDTFLFVEPGAKILARGRKDAPIVFTSSAPVGQRAPGQWAGLVLCGQSTVNKPGGTIAVEGLEGPQARNCGGGVAADNSGVLQYVRIEFAGSEIVPDVELNGLSLYGVGSGTTIDHVQVHFGKDDGIEWFGGTVNAKYLLVTGAEDDSFDWSYGFTGKVQYGIVLQGGSNESNNGIEADNDDAQFGNTPLTNPTFANLTVWGDATGANADGDGALLRRGTGGLLTRSVFANFKGNGIVVDNAESVTLANSGALSVSNSFFCGNAGGNFGAGENAAGFDANAWGTDAARANTQTADCATLGLAGIANLGGPTFGIAAGSVLNVASPSSPVPADAFFEANNFVGACGQTCAEFEGWTAFPQENAAQ
jgi:hypothetical protein